MSQPPAAAPLSRYVSRASNASGTGAGVGGGGGRGGGGLVISRSSLRDEDIPMLVPVDPKEFWLTREESISRGLTGMGRIGSGSGGGSVDGSAEEKQK